MFVEVFLFVALLLVYAIVKDSKPKGMPPGPLEIPFIGNMPIESSKQVEDLRKKYGDIFTVRLGLERTVVVSDYKTGKELMASSDCVDRPDLFKLFAVCPEESGGLVGSNGLQWVHDRRFVLRHLRDLGMGKTHLEKAIHEEARALVDDIKSSNGKPIQFPISFRTAVLNVIWQLVAGKRYEFNSPDVEQIFQLFEEFRDQSMFVFIEGFFPIVSYLPRFIKTKFGDIDIMERFRNEMKRIIYKCIEEHQENLDESNPRDLIDDYLIEMKNNNDDDSFRLGALTQIISDLFGAGSDTVTNNLRFVVLYMLQYPDVVAKCQQEIDRVVAPGALVSIHDKPRLPYVEAFANEALRKASMIFMNVQRMTSKDIPALGYVIPKGTTVTVNSFHVHHDGSFWDDPETFKPERFLDENGKFHQKNARVFAFGSGKRQCLGEPLARMEFFLFSAALLQNFTVHLPEGAVLKGIKDSVGVRTVHNQKFIYKAREMLKLQG